jgi:hypothetical protein|tara:strand:- start:68 stop:262 length:195 start_codon:yes stop_codon:yes gene_type:complete
MDYVYLTQKILKNIRARQEELIEVVKTGSVQDWNQYNKVIGELSGLSFAENVILDLLSKVEKDE